MPLDRIYNCQDGQSYSDVVLNTYGTLDQYIKLLNDNNLQPNNQPVTGTQVQWDDTLVDDQTTQVLNEQNNVIYATLLGYTLPAQQNPVIQTYPDLNNAWYTAATDGETVIQIPELLNNEAVSVIKEIKTLTQSQFQVDNVAGSVTLMDGVSLAAGETLFVLYKNTVTTNGLLQTLLQTER